jgi:hypothetical protein
MRVQNAVRHTSSDRTGITDFESWSMSRVGLACSAAPSDDKSDNYCAWHLDVIYLQLSELMTLRQLQRLFGAIDIQYSFMVMDTEFGTWLFILKNLNI